MGARSSALRIAEAPLADALRDGALSMSRTGRPEERLIPMTSDGLFGVEGSDLLRVRFASNSIEVIFKGDPAPPILSRTSP